MSAGSRARDPELERRLRALPSVEEVAAQLRRLCTTEHAPAVTAARQAVDARRAELVEGAPPATSSNGDTDQHAAERDLVVRAAAGRAGAVVTFQGTTRDVDALHYEAYAEMAEERIAAIVGDAVERHGLCAAAAEHRTGDVPLSEPSVVVAASARHRGEAFAGAREIIDRVKAEAPIWKKEVESGEERWVDGSRP